MCGWFSAAGGLGLGPEPAQERLVLGERLVEQLHRDAAAQARVVSEEHERRRAGADRRDQAVAAAEHATDLVVQTGHHHSPRG